jgi:hypothetical protein
MKIFTTTNGIECHASTTLSGIAPIVGITANYIRVKFSLAKTDCIEVNGWKIYRTTLERIRGRGRAF